jgi:6-phosphogluconolactonase/glucosamine-6-phosphate isomerase/deaminase
MRFILNQNKIQGWDELADRLILELSNDNKVLWLISGGSNIEGEVHIIKKISKSMRNNLTIMFADERYGEVGHQDSNYQQLLSAGFDSQGTNFISILNQGMDFEATINNFTTMAQDLLQNSDIVIAQLGMGDDGHIAGILPHSDASLDHTNFVAGYSSNPYTRLTLTFRALTMINVAYVYAYGDTKFRALQDLKTKNLSLIDQPSQILKQINEAYVYNRLID